MYLRYMYALLLDKFAGTCLASRRVPQIPNGAGHFAALIPPRFRVHPTMLLAPAETSVQNFRSRILVAFFPPSSRSVRAARKGRPARCPPPLVIYPAAAATPSPARQKSRENLKNGRRNIRSKKGQQRRKKAKGGRTAQGIGETRTDSSISSDCDTAAFSPSCSSSWSSFSAWFHR